MNFVSGSLRNKLIVVLLTTSLSPIMIVGWLSFVNARNSLRTIAIDALESIIDQKIQTVELFFLERSQDIQAAQEFYNIKANLPIVSQFANDRTHPEYVAAKKMLDGQLKTFQKAYDYADVMLVNSEGVIVYASEETHEGSDLGEPLPDPSGQVFEEGKKGIYFSDIFPFGEKSDMNEMMVSAPIYDFDGMFAGVAVLEIDMTPIYRMIQDTAGLGETEETLIGQRIDNEVVFLSPLRHDPDAALTRKVAMGSDIAVPMQKAVQGLRGVDLSVDYRGEEVIAHWQYLPSLNWGLVGKIDQREAFAPVMSLRRTLIVFSISLTFLLIGLSYWASRRLTDPINSLRELANRISSGDFSVYPEVKSDDEVGRLSDTFIEMARELEISITELQGEIAERKRAEEELKEYKDHLEGIVQERTTELEERVSEVERLNQGMTNLAEDMQVINANLESTTRQLSEANKELEAFSYSVSHDLRAPLRAIEGFSRMLAGDYASTLDKEGQRLLKVITDNTQTMANLIDDLLDLSRLGRTKMRCQITDANKLVKAVQKELTAEVPDRSIRWDIKDLPNIRCDPSLIRQVFVNLLSNAVKYTKTRKTAKIEIGSMTENDEIIFYSKDNGVGFDMKYVEKLFEVFQRLHSSEEFSGTGVGLAIVKRIVQRHGGRVWAKGQVDKGATVYFTLQKQGETDEL
ncbi:MAG: ATP-binding protein [Candidatus Neomarinimicrobiota bacterium]